MPKLLAEFELDPQGMPKYVIGGNEKHYQLRLFIQGAPVDASSVKYLLHQTYIEPVRLVSKGAENFEEYLTSYGDYNVQAILNRKEGGERIVRSLTDALKERYGPNASPEITTAIEELAMK